MKKKLLLFTICISIFSLGYSQTKSNYTLTKKINESINPDELLHVLVKGNIEVISSIIQSSGGVFKYSSGKIAAVSISVAQIANLIASNDIERIEAYPPTYQPLNDSVLFNTNTTPVHLGAPPLPQAYDGTGVVMGFIDTGIDWTHPDFNDALGKTRIKFIWDHATAMAPSPAGFAYGTEWDSTSIANGACTHNDNANLGHGTHVVGKAAGSAMATGEFLGIAPNSDIIVVALDFFGNQPQQATAITDAVKYIYDKAFAMGKPCVINASVGSNFGSHDGLDLEAQLIDNLIHAQPGRAFVAAAGNDGYIPFHLEYNVSADTNFTLFPTPANNVVYMEIYADTIDLKDVKFSLGADQLVPNYSFRGATDFFNVDTALNIVFNDTIYNASNQRIATIQSSTEIIDKRYYTWIAVLPDSLTYKWRLSATSSTSGKFDLWNFDVVTGKVQSIINSGIPSSAVMKDSMYYKLPDTDKTISSSFQCLSDVLTVGNYYNRKSYIDVNGATYTSPTSVPGAYVEGVSGNSYGPTRDGRIKPDICSPGDMTIAAAESIWTAANSTSNILALGGKHARNGKTSHAAPGVAGIAALYLQKNPTATANEVYQAIIKCPIQDEFTGNCLPDNKWGYGKVNAFGALNEVLTTSQPRDSSICEGNDAMFITKASGTGLSYQWVIELNDTCTLLSNVAPYSGTDTDTLRITAASTSLNGSKYRCVISNTYSCDITSDTALLTVNPSPTITSSASAPDVCFSNNAQNSTLTYSATTNAPTSYSIIWNGAANAAGFLNAIDSIFLPSPITINIPAAAAAATYTGNLIVKNATSCENDPGNGFTLMVAPQPTITIDTAADVCFSASAQNTNLIYSATTNTPTSYSLSWDATATAQGFIPVLDAALSASPISIAVPASASAGTYTATITAKNASSCVSSAGKDFTVTILSSPLVTSSAGGNNEVCTNSSITISSASTDASNIIWTHNGNGSISNETSVTPTYTSAMADTSNLVILTMTASSTNNCGTSNSVAYDTISVRSLPLVTSQGLTATYCYDAKAVTLTGIPSGGTFGGTAGITNSTDGIFEPIVAGTGTHTVIYTYTNQSNCSNTSSQTTTVLSYAASQSSCNKSDKFAFDSNFSNNIFTPNGDGINDEFEINYTGTPSGDFNLSIFDRWGNQLFSTANANVKWDGRTTAGLKVGNGTYFYILLNDGVKYKGYFSLLD